MSPLLLFLLLLPFCIATSPKILRPPATHRTQKLKFGHSTHLTSTGTHLLIGANAFSDHKGLLYIYALSPTPHLLTTLSPNTTQPAETPVPRQLRVVPRGSAFAFALAANPTASCIVATAPGHDLQRGAVYLFRGEGDAVWTEGDILVAPNRRAGDSFGWAVAIDHASHWVAISAKGRRANNGEVYLFRCSDCANCTLVQRLVPPDHTDSVGPRGIRIRNNFGVSLAMSAKGDVLAVGSTGFDDERGAVYVYVRKEEEGWVFLQRVTSLKGERFAFFGFKVAMDGDARRLVVGADGEDGYRGAAYVFQRGEDGLFQQVQELTAGVRGHEDNFGGSVAMSADGRAVVVGAPGANRGEGVDHGTMFLFEQVRNRQGLRWEVAETVSLGREHASEGDFFAWAVGISGDGAVFVATAPDCYDGVGVAAVGRYVVAGRREIGKGPLVDDDRHGFGKEEL